MMPIPMIGRVSVEVAGERVVVGPFSQSDLDTAVTAGDMDSLELFAAHIQEPADAAERGMLWVGAALLAWKTAVEELSARLANGQMSPKFLRLCHALNVAAAAVARYQDEDEACLEGDLLDLVHEFIVRKVGEGEHLTNTDLGVDPLAIKASAKAAA